MTTPVGQYRHLVSLVQPGPPTPDPDGGWGETWVPLTPSTWHCAIQAASLRDLQRLSGGLLSTTATHVLRGRYHAQLTRAARIQFGDRVFDVESVHDLEERQIEHEVIAHEQLGAPAVAPAPPTTLAYHDLVVQDGATHYWRLGDLGGTIAIDSVGYAHGTIGGGVTLNQPGAVGGSGPAMTFDGTTGKIVTTPVPVTAPLTCSVEAWITCANVDDPNFRVIVTNRDLTPEAAIFVAVSENKVYVYCAPAALISNRSVTDGHWHHVVFVSDGTSGWIYLDGVLDNTNPSLARGVTSHPVGIGYDIKSNGYYFPGSLDDVALYPRALSAAEILHHYQVATGA
jgi:head-tail adaptor